MLSNEVSVTGEAAIRDYLERLFAECMDVPRQDLLGEESFFSLGLTSLIHTEVFARLDGLADGLPSTLLFEYPNLDELSAYLAQKNMRVPPSTSIDHRN